MYLFLLHLADTSTLTHAFDSVLDHPRVTSCAVEPSLQRLRFLAPRATGEALVAEIYRDGGLVWCSRHEEVPGGRKKLPPPLP